MGLPPSAVYAAAQADCFDVWPENWPAVQAFLRLQTQWVLDAAGDRVGINYAALPPVERALALRGRRARATFDDLQRLESEWLRLESFERQVQAALPPPPK